LTNKFITRGVEAALEFVFDGGGAALAADAQGDLEVPFDCYIEEAALLADQDGAVKIDIWMDSYGNYPPTNDDTITAGAEPEIAASGSKDKDTTLTGWTRELPKGRALRFNIDSCTTITRVVVSLKVTRT